MCILKLLEKIHRLCRFNQRLSKGSGSCPTNMHGGEVGGKSLSFSITIISSANEISCSRHIYKDLVE